MNTQKLITAYHDLMHHLKESMEHTLDEFTDAFETSKEKLNHQNDLTADELERVSSHVKRDVHHAAQHMDNHDNESLAQWLKFDIELMENMAWEAFLSIADKTRIQLANIEEKAKYHEYQSGDITIAGTFACKQCHKEIAFKKTSQIPDCPACGHSQFVRK